VSLNKCVAFRQVQILCTALHDITATLHNKTDISESCDIQHRMFGRFY